VWLVAAGFGITAGVAAISARLAAPVGAYVPSDAAVWHGAMQVYGRVAHWAGSRAMACEQQYWRSIQ
jgi:hypothetical protein